MSLKTISHKAAKALAVTASLALLPAAASALTVDLTPAFAIPDTFQGREVIAVGESGLFLDSDTSAPAYMQTDDQTAFQNFNQPLNNFTWLNVTMEIDDNSGNATISGTMSNNARANDLYALNMTLTGACVQSNGGACTSVSAQPNLDLRAFLEDPANGQNDVLGNNLNTGIEWQHVSLNVAALGQSPAYTGVTALQGWTMAPLHDNPAELYIWSNSPGEGDLYFGAWYQALNHNGKRIAVGDTKAFGTLLDGPQPPTVIPEPGTMLLLGTAGLGLLSRKRRKA